MTVTHKTICRFGFLFLLPLAGAFAAIIAAQIFVSHDTSTYRLLALPYATPVPSSRTIAAEYHLAVANTFVFIVCVTSLYFAIRWIVKSAPSFVPPSTLNWFRALFAIALLIACLSFKITGAVDDEASRLLFAATYKIANGDIVANSFEEIRKLAHCKLSGFALAFDARILGFFVFLSYMTSAMIVAAAATHPANMSKAEGERRVAVVNSALFAMAIVLVVAMITIKYRFDLGLATLEPPKKDTTDASAFLEYQNIASAISFYMAAIQSIFLALLYFPAVYLLAPQTIAFDISNPNFSRFAKLLAIFAPPITTKIIDVFAAAPKPS